MAPVQSKVSGPTRNAANPPAATAPNMTARKAGLRSAGSRTLTAQQQLLEAEESNKVRQKKHPAAGSRKGTTTETADKTFTVVRGAEAAGSVSWGCTTNRQGGTITNPPTRTPSLLPGVSRSNHHTSSIPRRSPPATPPPTHLHQNDDIVPALAQSAHGGGNAADSEGEDWRNRPAAAPDFRRIFQDQEEDDEIFGIVGSGSPSRQEHMALDEDDREDGADIEDEAAAVNGDRQDSATAEPEEDAAQPDYTPSLSPNEQALGGKRLASASPEDSRRAKRNTANTNSARPKAGDFQPDAKHAVLAACSKFRAILASNGSFLDPLMETNCVAEAFQWGCNDCGVSVNLAKEHTIVIRKSTSQMRGELKTTARAAVEAEFGFIAREAKTIANKRLYERLVHDNLFLYERWQDPAKPEGMWFGEILFKIVRKMWFAHSRDEGIIHSSHFNPVRPETMALVWTAVRCALDEWKDGSFSPVHFTALAYEGFYDEIFAGLVALQSTADGKVVIQDLGSELWQESSNGMIERRQHANDSFTQEQHIAAVRDAAARKARKQAEAEADAAALTDY